MAELNGEVTRWLGTIGDVCSPLVCPGVKSTPELNPENMPPVKRLEVVITEIQANFDSLKENEAQQLYNMLHGYRNSFARQIDMIADVTSEDLQSRKEIFQAGIEEFCPLIEKLAVKAKMKKTSPLP